ncbi:MAG: hypothetical protein IPI69_01235 [Bacteroidales bacterium]|nr:hypothetical protein [Bacteroidales bacterium]
MPLSQLDYDKLCQSLGIPQGRRNYQNGYLYCDRLFNSYFQNVITHLNSNCPKKIVVLFLESCPANTANYIFECRKAVNWPNDSYLWNIYTGFFGKNPANMLKQDCLNDLLNYRTIQGTNVPVVILDLFPFHGINLNGYRKNICSNIISNLLILEDVINRVRTFPSSIERLFLFGVPYIIWNYLGGYGDGSIYMYSLSAQMNNLSVQTGPLGSFHNTTVVVNIGGQNLSSRGIQDWRINENIV